MDGPNPLVVDGVSADGPNPLVVDGVSADDPNPLVVDGVSADGLNPLVVDSGDSSAVARWTVDQELVGSKPTHGGNLISVVRLLSGFTQPIW